MPNKSNAIHPNYFKDFRETIKPIDDKPIELKEEQVLADMAELAGWKVLKEYINDLKAMLDKLQETAIAGGASFEEIGQKTIVVTLAKSYLNQVIERVENASEAIANQSD